MYIIYHTSRTVSAYNHVWQDNVEDGQTDCYLSTNVLHTEHPAHEITAHNSMERERYNQQYKAVCSNRIMSMMTNSNICTPITELMSLSHKFTCLGMMQRREHHTCWRRTSQ